MPRFFVSREQIDDSTITIKGADVNHIKNVLRLSAGDELSVSDGEGTDYHCTIAAADKQSVILEIMNSWNSFTELPVKLYLFQSVPKSDKMDMIIQKAVELGVYEIIPVYTEYTVVKLTGEKEQKRQKRWQTIAESAAKQAGRGLIPKVSDFMTYEKALSAAKELDRILMPYEKAEGMEAARSIMDSLGREQSIGIFIGPEGGFSAEEVKKAKDAGAEVLSLGRRILRTETAGLAVLSILMFRLESN